MKTNRKRFILSVFVGLTFLFSACDTNSGLTGDTDQEQEIALLTDGLVSDLGLSESDASAVKDIVEKHGRGNQEPGFLWNMAAELQDRLTDEQKERLFRRFEQHRQNGLSQGHGPQMGPGKRKGPRGDGFLASILTDDQKEAVQTLHESYRDQFKDLAMAIRDGSLTPQDARAQREVLEGELKTALDALLTDEQRAALEAHRAEMEVEREAFRAETIAVRNEVLALTDQQIQDWEAAHEAKKAAADENRAAVDAGTMTRQDAHEALKDLHASLRTEMETILSPDQLELVKIHAAIHWRMHNGRNGQRPGGGGPNGPGVQVG